MKQRAATFKRMWIYMRPHARAYLFGITGIAAANLVINVYFAKMLMGITSGVLALSSGALATSVAWMALVTAGTCFLVFAAGKGLINTTMRALDGLRTAFFDHLLALPVPEIESRHSGDLLSRATNDARMAGNVYISGFQEVTSLALSALGCALYMVRLDWRIGLLGILTSSVPLGANVPFASPMHRIGLEVQERKASVTSAFSDIVQGAPVIRHYNLADVVAHRVVTASEILRNAGMKRIRLESLRVSLDGVSQLATFLFAVYASYRAVLDPSLIPLVVAVSQLTNPIRYLFSNLGRLLSSIQSNLASAERVLETLDIPPEPPRYPRPVPQPAEGTESTKPSAQVPALAIEDVSFRYPGGREDVLSGISFAAGQGAVVALVGPSGGGKSTLVKVILGLYPPASGSMRAFGRDFFDAPLAEWRALFSYVPQDAFLFAGTVYDNMLGGLTDPGQGKVEEAAGLANALDFIGNLPGGFQAPVGERAANLSGGQKQRIAIARAILRDAPVLLLDEATSALDSESEGLVQEALQRLMKDRTTVVIAHRLPTVRDASGILYMEGGRIIERGTHDRLMEIADGKYRRLVEEGSTREASAGGSGA